MIGCFGKLASSADFVSLHGAAEEVREFDGWLQASLAALRDREDWQALFDRLPVCFFSYRASNGNQLVGGLISSRDASGRRYPFFIFQVLKATSQAGLVNPFTLSESFAAHITPLLRQAVEGSDQADVFARIKALRPLQAHDLDLFRRVHAKFLRDYSFNDVVLALQRSWSNFDAQAALAYLRHLRCGLTPTDDGVLALPLPAERGLKNPVADLWSTWLMRLSGRRDAPAVSLLADDFMHPRLYCFPSRHGQTAYRVLSGVVAQGQHRAMLDAVADGPATTELDRPLEQVIDRLVGALDTTCE